MIILMDNLKNNRKLDLCFKNLFYTQFAQPQGCNIPHENCTLQIINIGSSLLFRMLSVFTIPSRTDPKGERILQ